MCCAGSLTNLAILWRLTRMASTPSSSLFLRDIILLHVISHKGRRITDAMLVRGLTLGVRSDEIEFLKKLYGFEPTLEFMHEYVQWNDERLMSGCWSRSSKRPWAGQFMRRLVERRLFDRIQEVLVTEFTDLILDASVFEISATPLGVQPVIFKVHRSPPTRKEGRSSSAAALRDRVLGGPSIGARRAPRVLRTHDGVDDHQERLKTSSSDEFRNCSIHQISRGKT